MIIIGIIIIGILLIGIGIYNSLIGKKNQVTNAFSAIDVMLKKRYDLIPNLVETVKQYMQYEADTLTKITQMRTQATTGNLTETEKVQLDQQISTAVRGVMLNVENYPDLKANANFINLQSAWTESEEQIAAARRTYNAAVTSYNNAVMMFPSSIFANMMNYQAMQVLETPAEERKNISAKDLFNS